MNYVVVKDFRDDKLFIDKSDSMIRNFEEVLLRGTKIEDLKKRYPEAKVLV